MDTTLPAPAAAEPDRGTPAAAMAPIAATQRIEALDVVRGFKRTGMVKPEGSPVLGLERQMQ